MDNHQILSKNSRHKWLFQIFLSIFGPYLGINLIWPSLLTSFHKSLILLVAIFPLIPYYILNRTRVYILIFIIGIASNHFTIVLNNGYMPVSKEAYTRFMGELLPVKNDGEIIIKRPFKYKYINDNTIVPFLGDIIYFPYAGGVSSVGDWLIHLTFLVFLLTKIEIDYKRKNH